MEITKYGETIDLSTERHTACPVCRKDGGDKSGNNLYVYGLDENGKHRGCRCFACGWSFPNQEWLEENQEYNWEENKVMGLDFNKSVLADIKKEYTFIEEKYRGIRPDIYKYFGVMHKIEGGKPVEQIYPTFRGKEVVGFKRRELPKTFLMPYGDVGADVDFFSQWRWGVPESRREVIICSGEIDMLSAYQMLKDWRASSNSSKGTEYPYTPVVSSTVGELGAAAQARNNYEWLNKFNKIIICPDSDEAGRKAVDKMFGSIPKNKMYVMELPMKDANEMLLAGKSKEFIDAYFRASPYVPVGLKGSSSLIPAIREHALVKKIPLPPFMHRVQKMMAGGIPLGVIVNLISSSGTGKCFAPGTKILMYDMTCKSVEDVKVGDRVMGDDGTPRNVVRLSKGMDSMYRVKQKKGEDYVVNSNHILSLRGTGKQSVVNMNVLDFMNLPDWEKDRFKGYKATLNNLDSSCFHDEELAYFLGLWLAEGSSDAAALTICRDDRELVDFVSHFCSEKGWEITIPPSCDREHSIGMRISGGFRKMLREWNLLGNKHVPGFIKVSSDSVRRSIVAGFIDGDGHKTANGWEMTLKDNKLVDDVVLIMRSVGLSVTLKDKFNKCQNFEGEIYKRVHIYGDTFNIPNKLIRKKCEIRRQIKNPSHTGISIQGEGVGEYYGFEVDGNHLFCLGDLTVTHNSTIVDEIVYHWIFNSPYKLGILSLESDSGEYGTKLLSRHVGRKINLIESVDEKIKFLDSEFVKEKEKELLIDEHGQDRFILLDDRDGNVETIKDSVEKMVVQMGCKVIVCDPLQDIIACLPDDEQNKFMSWQKGLLKSHGVTFFNVNHTKKALTGGGAGSKGVDLVEEDSHGSSSIYKSAACNLLFGRNKEAENPIVRNTTIMKVSKMRWTGNTSPFAGKYFYDNATHTLHDYDDWIKANPDLASFEDKPNE